MVATMEELNKSSTTSMEEIKKKENQKQQDKTFHVLAVDDSLSDRKLLEKLLTLSSYQVTCVESGDKALEYLGLIQNDDYNNNGEISNPISSSSSSSSSSTASSTSSSKQKVQGSKVNLIMTDYSMPGMSGYDLLKIVKGSSWKDVPVVVMSSENVPSRINMCLEGGAKEFLLKPLKLSDLKKLQPQLLDNNSHQQAGDKQEKIDEIPTNFDDEINNNNNTDNQSLVNSSTITMRTKIISQDLAELRPNDIVVA